MPGNRSRGRLVSGLYKYIGVTNPPIANDISEYIRMTTNLLSNKEKLILLKSEIKQKFDVFRQKPSNVDNEIIGFVRSALFNARKSEC